MIILKKKINFLKKLKIQIKMTKRDKQTYTEKRSDFKVELPKYGKLKKITILKFSNRKIMKDKMGHLLMDNQELQIN